MISFPLFSYFTITDELLCGIKPLKIVGGSEVTPYSLPWQVALVSVGHSRPFCGGTLISPTHVLTAGHCLGFWAQINFDIIVGEHTISSESDGTRHTICRAVRHPNYVRYPNNDFAIVHLNKPVVTGPRAVPACLPAADDENLAGDALAGLPLTVSGWGRLSSGGSSPDVLHSVSVPGITNAQCQQAYGNSYSISDQMVCAGNVDEGGIDSCQGDSGG